MERIPSLSKSPIDFKIRYKQWHLMRSSIVAVHGLNGDSVKTWRSKTNNKFWLGDADMLPFTMKQSRILTFRYNAAVTALFGKTSADRILHHAQTLIAELVADRQVCGIFTPMKRNSHLLG